MPSNPQLIVKSGKKLKVIHLIGDKMVEKDCFYIHFMRRKDLVVEENISQDYIICVDGFISFNSEAELKSLFSKYGLPVSEYEESEYAKDLLLERRKSKLKNFRREIEHYKGKSIYNILFHYYLHKL